MGKERERMRILEIKHSFAIVQLESTELDRIINDYLDVQYALGYEEGFNDWKKATEYADLDNDDTEDE